MARMSRVVNPGVAHHVPQRGVKAAADGLQRRGLSRLSRRGIAGVHNGRGRCTRVLPDAETRAPDPGAPYGRWFAPATRRSAPALCEPHQSPPGLAGAPLAGTVPFVSHERRASHCGCSLRRTQSGTGTDSDDAGSLALVECRGARLGAGRCLGRVGARHRSIGWGLGRNFWDKGLRMRRPSNCGSIKSPAARSVHPRSSRTLKQWPRAGWRDGLPAGRDVVGARRAVAPLIRYRISGSLEAASTHPHAPS